MLQLRLAIEHLFSNLYLLEKLQKNWLILAEELEQESSEESTKESR